MNYKKYLLIILTICFGTSVSFANLQVKADSVVVNTTDSVGNQQEKTEKPKKSKEKKAKNKDSKTKGKEKAKGKDSKAAIKAPKVSKKTQTTEYKAKRQATVEALDSIIKTTGRSTVITPDHLMSFLDEKCKEFDWDPVLMDSIASAMYTLYGNEVWGERRFIQLKQRHPTFVEAYYTEGLLFHTLAWINSDGVSYDPEFLAKAKVQIDSAKLIVPESEEPYMLWVKWQGKYDPEGITAEIDTLKMRIPDYPGYLEVARDFAQKSDNDRSFLPSARKCYSKAEHDHMKLGDYQLYSTLCYRIGTSQKLKEDFLEGIEVATEGLRKFPNDPNLIRMKLWNSAYLPTVPARTIDGQRVPQLTAEEKKERWDSAYAVSLEFIELPDSFTRTATDYRWLGQINMETKHYSDAVKYYKKQIKAGITDSTQYVTALLNIINADRQLSNYEDAILTFEELESYKKARGMEVDASDYNAITHVYRIILGDSLETKEYRMQAYETMDSLCRIAAKADPNNSVVFESRILDYLFSYLAVKHGEVDITDEAVLTFSQRIVDMELEYQATLDPFSIPHNNSYILLYAYRDILEHYANSGFYEEAYFTSQKMLDLPLAFELTDLSKGQSANYTSWMSRAEQISNLLKKTYGGKKRK